MFTKKRTSAIRYIVKTTLDLTFTTLPPGGGISLSLGSGRFRVGSCDEISFCRMNFYIAEGFLLKEN